MELPSFCMLQSASVCWGNTHRFVERSGCTDATFVAVDSSSVDSDGCYYLPSCVAAACGDLNGIFDSLRGEKQRMAARRSGARASA